MELKRIPANLASKHSQQRVLIEYIPQVGYLMRFEGGRVPEDLKGVLDDYVFEFEGAGPFG
jgi:hypothetical protein